MGNIMVRPNVELTGDTKAQLLGRPVERRVGGI